ncbi:MAG: tyrosine-type recombinase/integrase [Roseofilum sp. SID1]|nr:tyrosine-type recombinase/integrase [Roseofilum sp. SID2]MBP0037654.1 tyrosine-type recombinase/integrase [Roseofilum sp. SID1]
MVRHRLPKIGIRNNNGAIQIRFQYQQHNYSLGGLGQFGDRLSTSRAQEICEKIRFDILGGQFDPTLKKYQPNQIVLPKEEPTLYIVWQRYKLARQGQISITTQKRVWRDVDRVLDKLPREACSPNSSSRITPELLKHYSPGTLRRIYDEIQTASNWAFSQNLITDSHWGKLKKELPKPPKTGAEKRRKQAFTEDEVACIMAAIGEQRPDCLPFCRFLLLTGCRPEDAIALTWEDVADSGITFDKAYSRRTLKPTKNEKVRQFPMTDQLAQVLEQQGQILQRKGVALKPSQLVFPGQQGGYLNLDNFTSRAWRPVVKQLVTDGLISQYLPTYSLRNTSASFYLRKGVDPSTIAYLFETSERMLERHYFSPNSDIQLPDI